MSKKVQFNPNFWSAVKRKNLLDVLEIVFTESGMEDAGQIAHDTTRFTSAAINRMMDACGVVEADEPTDEQIEQAEQDQALSDAGITDDGTPDGEYEETMETPDETEAKAEKSIPDHDFKAIRKAIKKGKGKKALKLIVEAKENGARGSVLKGLTREAKAL